MTRSPVSPLALAAVALGGALGAVARWWLGEVVPDGGGFPWTTFAINVSGSFLLALAPLWARVRSDQLVRLFVGPGLLGGWTTLSAYAEHGRALLDDGQPGVALAYLLGTLGCCLAAVMVGAHLAGRTAEPDWTEDTP